MHPSPRYLLEQTPVISAMVRAVIGTMGKKTTTSAAGIDVPGREYRGRVPAPSAELCRDFVRYCGGDPSPYRNGRIPALLFSQWAFPLITEGLRHLPFDLQRVLNFACDLTIAGPLVADRGTLELTVQLVELEESDKGVRMATRVTTAGKAGAEPTLTAMMHALVPKKRKPGQRREKSASELVPFDARKIGERRFSATAGRDFAILTGDINPVHWLPPYARAAGFKRPILHGFAQMGWVAESLVRAVFAG
ncbi:MAG: hypothetical protein KC609_00160, partial [Myxococcales bacterium]|nr:hypothetical protein [Myxococcales bacterium]